jgi:hypothetical protein
LWRDSKQDSATASQQQWLMSNMKALWETAPCSLFDVARRFRSAMTVMMEVVRTYETSVLFEETAQRYIPEGHFHTRSYENLKSHDGHVLFCSDIYHTPHRIIN